MKGNLLIIDDEVSVTESLSYVLKKHADKISVTTNAKDALMLLKSNQFHCVISDISMPDMSGVELIKEARENMIHVPFIFFSAVTHDEVKLQVAQYPATMFVMKPDIKTIVNFLGPMLQLGMK